MLEKKSTDFKDVDEVKALKRRWYILAVYVYYATFSCFQWVEYSIITNVVMRYYNVSASTVDWTAVMFMIVWPIFVFPSSFLIDKLGLRFAALVGCFLTAIGAAVKLFSISPDRFSIVLLGQAIVSLSQVSTVCSIGVFGVMLGSAMGFLIPPIIVKDDPDISQIGASLKVLCWGLTLVVVPACVAVAIYFPHQPANPPSEAQAEERRQVELVTLRTFLRSVKGLLKNKAFVMQMFGYGICYGIFSAFGTLLNQFILYYFPGAAEDAGRMGLVMILSGMVGGVLVGVILDKTHRYKETTFVIYLMSTIFIGGLIFALELKLKLLIYLAIGCFGFFLNAYIPAGIEFATELTYPANESTTTSLMTAVSQLLGVAFTLGLGWLNAEWGTFWSLSIQSLLLALGTVLTSFVPNSLRRQAAFQKAVEFKEIPQEELTKN
ncbi:heme transporter FLVCR2-like isoform X2 [Cylas formicarius]|uniref:heme transporter FLVCR2-like isoform X2 n=1 Tax=Cylas formicarius TaxID=197179 RepID=UPI002958C8B9|nr:heme transporter FLVCR2-like isoform X2 [Cylas formicarius]